MPVAGGNYGKNQWMQDVAVGLSARAGKRQDRNLSWATRSLVPVVAVRRQVGPFQQETPQWFRDYSAQ